MSRGADWDATRYHRVAQPHAAWLEPSPQTFPDHAAMADFCRGVVLSNHVAALPDALRQAFVEQVVDEVVRREGGLCLDYVRLNADAAG